MAYADSIRSATATMSTIASLIEGALTDINNVSVTASQTISSTTYTDATSTSQSVAVAAGESVILIFSGQFSAATANDEVGFQLLRDSTVLTSKLMKCVGATDVKDGVLNWIDQPSAGTYTYKIQFKNNTGARNVTLATRVLSVVKVQSS